MLVPRVHIQKILNELAQMKLVTPNGENYDHATGDLFTLREDPRTLSHHWNWRKRALETANSEKEIHYTDVFSIDPKDYKKIRDLCIKLIKTQGEIVGKSGCETGAAICLDFFPL